MKSEITLIELKETVSTNTFLASYEAPHPSPITVVTTEYQTAGRGQGTNTWESERGKNLLFSIKVHPTALPITHAFALSEVIALSIRDAVASFIDELSCNSSIIDNKPSITVKWPNDIYVGDRKICGMLIENGLATDGGIASSVIGIGLNVNQLQFNSLVNATSLAACTGRQYNLPRELEAFLAVFEGLLPRLGSPVLQEAYTHRLYRKGIPARYHNLLTDSFFTGVILGVEPDGRLRVRDAGTGEELLFRFKELGYIL